MLFNEVALEHVLVVDAFAVQAIGQEDLDVIDQHLIRVVRNVHNPCMCFSYCFICGVRFPVSKFPLHNSL